TRNTAGPKQIGWVTRDLAAMEDALCKQLGVKKWIRQTGVEIDPSQCSFRGKPTGFVADVSLSYLGDMELEIIAPVSGDDNLYEEFLRTHGPGLHHTCIEVDDIRQAVKEYTGDGTEVVFRLSIPG